MRVKQRKLMPIILSVALLIGALPLSIFAADAKYQNSEVITAISLPDDALSMQEIAIESDSAPSLPTSLDATVTSILWEEIALPQQSDEETSPDTDDEKNKTEWQQTISNESLSIDVEWELLGDVLFSTEREQSFIYRAKISNDSYEVADVVVMPEITVNIVGRKSEDENKENNGDNSNSDNSDEQESEEDLIVLDSDKAPNLSQNNSRAIGSVNFAGVTLAANTYYTISGNSFTTSGADADNYKVYLEVTEEEATLHLNNFSLRDTNSATSFISTYETLTVNTIGAVSLTSETSDSVMAKSLIFKGGALSIKSTDNNGITATGNITISNNLTVVANNAVSAANIYLQDGANLTANANDDGGYGITATELIVPTGASVWANGSAGRNARNGGIAIDAYLNVKGGSVTAFGGNLYNTLGGSAGDGITRLNLESGYVRVRGGSAASAFGQTGGTAITNDAVVEGGKLEATGGDGGVGGSSGSGIGFHIWATGGESYIKGGNLSIADGTLGYAVADGGSDKSTIAGGNVYATGGYNSGTNGPQRAYRQAPNITTPDGKQADHSIGLSAPGTYDADSIHDFASRYVGISYSTPGEVTFAGVNLIVGNYYKFSENGSMTIGSLADYNVYFTNISGKNTLTLSSVSVFGSFAKSLITAGGDLDIILQGNSSLTNSQTGVGVIEVVGNLNFFENGSLSVFGREFGISSGGNITISGGAITSSGSAAKGFAANNLTLNIGSSLNVFGALAVTGNTAINDSYIHVSANDTAYLGTVSISGNSSVTATGRTAFANNPTINAIPTIIAGDTAATAAAVEQSTDYHTNKFVKITTERQSYAVIRILDDSTAGYAQYSLVNGSYYNFDSTAKTLTAATAADYDLFFEVTPAGERLTFNSAVLTDTFIYSAAFLEIVLKGESSITNKTKLRFAINEVSTTLVAGGIIFSGSGKIRIDHSLTEQYMGDYTRAVLSNGNISLIGGCTVEAIATAGVTFQSGDNLTVNPGCTLITDVVGDGIKVPLYTMDVPIANSIFVQNDLLLYNGRIEAKVSTERFFYTNFGEYDFYSDVAGSGIYISSGNVFIRGGDLDVGSASFFRKDGLTNPSYTGHRAIYFDNANSQFYIYPLPATIDFNGSNGNPVFLNYEEVDITINNHLYDDENPHGLYYELNNQSISIAAKGFPDINSMMMGAIGFDPRTVTSAGNVQKDGDVLFLGGDEWVLLKDPVDAPRLLINKNVEDNNLTYQSLTAAEQSAVTGGSLTNLTNQQVTDLVGTELTDGLAINATTKPAFTIDDNAILFRHTNEGGKNGEVGITKDAVVDVFTKQFEVGESAVSNKWSLTLYDSSRADFDAYNLEIVGREVIFEYQNATYGHNEYISVIIGDGLGGILYYGKVRAANDAADESGIITFTLPADLELEEGDYLDILAFNEQVNGEGNTDYSSKLIPVPAIAQSALSGQTIEFSEDTVVKQYGDATFVNPLSGAKTAVSYVSSNTAVATVNEFTGHVSIVGRGSTTITATAELGTGSDGESYSSATDSYTITVSAKEITVTAGDFAVTKEYDNTTSGNSATSTGTLFVSGIAASDLSAVSVSPTIGLFSDKNVTTENKTATVSLALQGDTEGNYTLVTSSIDVPATITPKTASWSVGTVANKAYDGDTDATVTAHPTLSGTYPADNISVTNGTASFASENAANGIAVTAFGYSINGTDTAKSNYTLPTGQPNFNAANITKASYNADDEITVAINAKIDQATTVNLANYLSGLLNPNYPAVNLINYDNTVVTAPTYQSDSTGVLAFSILDTAPLGLQSGVITLNIKSDNHLDVTVLIDITVLDKDVPVLSADDLSKEYDGVAFTEADIENKTATFNGQPILGNWSLETTPSITKAGERQTLTLKFIPSDGEKYATVTTDISSEIIKKPITISVKLDKSAIIVGGTLPIATIDYGDVISGESLAPGSVTAQFSGLPTDSKKAGSYTVRWSNAQAMQTTIDALSAASNYDISYIDTAIFSINSAVTPPTVKTHTITATAGSNGTISPIGKVNVTEGNNQTFTITPNSGYRVLSVTIDGTNYGSITSFTFENVTTPHSISASFTQITTTDTDSDPDDLGEDEGDSESGSEQDDNTESGSKDSSSESGSDSSSSEDSSSDGSEDGNGDSGSSSENTPKIDITDSGEVTITPPANSGEPSGVTIGERVLSNDDYLVNGDGSITVTSEVLRALSNGEHNITVDYGNTSYQATIIVDDGVPLSASNFEETESESGIPLYPIIIVVVIVLGAVVFFVFRSKGRVEK